MDKLIFWKNWSFSQKFFAAYLVFQSVMWVLIPASYHDSLHYDPAETLMWGSTFNWGGAKHPPMAGYMLYHFCSLFNFPNYAIFLASQICMFFGSICIYKLARCFFDRNTAMMAALLITFYYFYNTETPKFNANTPHLLFVPMMLYCFYRGVTANKLHHWLLLAVSGAFAFLTKYYAGVFFLSFAAYIFTDREARKTLTTYKPYLAGIVFFLLLAPHLLHLYKTDFLVLKYISHSDVPLNYFAQLIMIAVAMIVPMVTMSAAALTTAFLDKKRFFMPKLKCVDPRAARYVIFVMAAQAAVLLLMGICGSRLDTRWTYQLYFPAGILIMAFYSEKVTGRTVKIFAVLTMIFSIILMGSLFIYSHFRSSSRRHLNRAGLIQHARSYYFEQTGREIPFIIGEVWPASLMQNAGKYQVRCAPDDDPILIGIHREKLRKHGALIVSSAPEKSGKNILEEFGQQPEWYTCEIPYRSRFGKTKKITFYFAVLKPAE